MMHMWWTRFNDMNMLIAGNELQGMSVGKTILDSGTC